MNKPNPGALRSEGPCLSAGAYLYVSNVAASMRWYCQVLGLKGYLYPRREPYVYAHLLSDNLHIGFILIDPASDLHWTPDAPVGRIEPETVNIGSDGVEELYARLRTRVTINERLSRGLGGGLRFAIKDPDHHFLVFHQAREGWPKRAPSKAV